MSEEYPITPCSGNASPVAPSAIPAGENVKVFIETGPGGRWLPLPAPAHWKKRKLVRLSGCTPGQLRTPLMPVLTVWKFTVQMDTRLTSSCHPIATKREDEYGGSLHNRLRFLREVTQAVADVVGKDRVGVRFAPLFQTTDEVRVYLGTVEDDPHETYTEAVKILEEIGIAYISLAEADWDDAPELPEAFRAEVRKLFSGVIMYAGRYTQEKPNGLSVLAGETLSDLAARS